MGLIKTTSTRNGCFAAHAHTQLSRLELKAAVTVYYFEVALVNLLSSGIPRHLPLIFLFGLVPRMSDDFSRMRFICTRQGDARISICKLRNRQQQASIAGTQLLGPVHRLIHIKILSDKHFTSVQFGVMACGATLKRTLDFDPLMNPASPKRRRCAPMMSPVSSPQKYLRMEPSPFGEVSSRLTTGSR